MIRTCDTRLSHGVEQYSDPDHGTVPIHTALSLATLTPKRPVAEDPGQEAVSSKKLKSNS
jgi:hypothetical protein